MGIENLTLPETTAILSRVLNRSLEYVRVTVESIQQQLALAGATLEAFTPTTFEQFAAQKLLKYILN